MREEEIEIRERLSDLKGFISEFLLERVKEAEAQGVVELTRAFVGMKLLRDEIEETFEEFHRVFEELKSVKIPEKFDQANVPTVHLNEGFRVTVSQLVRASIRGGKKDEAFKWLRENGMGDIVTETVNSSTLSALARSMEEDNTELNTELFNVAILPSSSVTRTNRSK